MVSGANAAPESIRSGAFGLNRSVRLSGETDCATAPFRSAPASPTMRPSTSNNSEYVLFVEQIVCYRGRARNASSTSIARNGLEAASGHPGARPQVQQAVQNKSKQNQIKPSKKAWICFYLFFRIGTFQWVTTDLNKKTFSRVTLYLKCYNGILSPSLPPSLSPPPVLARKPGARGLGPAIAKRWHIFSGFVKQFAINRIAMVFFACMPASSIFAG